MQVIELLCFGIFYMTYCLFALVVLLNLLIAMLGFTFSRVQEDAVLQWRLLYARNVLRMESLAEIFSKPPFNWWELRSGERVGDCYYVYSRTYNKVEDGAHKVMAVGMDWEDDIDETDPYLDMMARRIQTSWLKKRFRVMLADQKGRTSAKNILRRITKVQEGMPRPAEQKKRLKFGTRLTNPTRARTTRRNRKEAQMREVEDAGEDACAA